MNDLGVLRLPDHIHFGAGARVSVGPSAASLGTRALVVADGALTREPEFGEVLAALDAAGVEVRVHSEVVPELPVAAVETVAEAARENAPDVIVGYGGGSAIDLAKLVALLLRHPGPLERYYGENAVPGPVVPVIAMPTTAGTGSEVTPVAVVSDPARELKVGISDPAIVPRVAIVDPELSVGAPRSVTAHSGVDALVHAFESLTAVPARARWAEPLPVFVGANRLGSLLALEAIEAIVPALPRVVRDGSDRGARERMAWGSMLAGMAFGSAGTHLSHALQYPIGALTRTPHGLGTGLLLPYVLQACLPMSVESLGRAADVLGITAGSDVGRAQAVVDRVADVVSAIGLPASLADLGIEQSQLPRIAELALGVSRLAGNAPVPGADVVGPILEAAFVGDRERLRRDR
jgi:alcohol dehydrogenase